MRLLKLSTLSLVMGLLVSSVQAQTSSLMQRESLLPPVLTWLQQQGSKLTLIGEEGGLKGYLVESPTGKMQSVYVTPDGKHIVAGILLQQGGSNITGIQIGEMRQRFDDASKALGSDAASSSLIEGVQSVTRPAPATSHSEPSQMTPKIQQEEVSPLQEQSEVVDPVSPSSPELSPVQSSAELSPSSPSLELSPVTSAVAGADGDKSSVWVSEIERDTFINAANDTAYIEVGSRLAPVTLWKVADPKCPFCHSTWDEIKSLIFEKKIRVRIILINALNGSEPYSRELMASPNPSRLWLDSNAGRSLEINTDQNSQEWANAGEYLSLNMSFSRQFGVDRTPFLAYVAPDGRFYSALGKPNDMDGFLSAALIGSK